MELLLVHLLVQQHLVQEQVQLLHQAVEAVIAVISQQDVQIPELQQEVTVCHHAIAIQTLLISEVAVQVLAAVAVALVVDVQVLVAIAVADVQ